MNVRYAPEIFDQPTFERAKQAILTPEQGLSTEQRWESETKWLMDRIGFNDGPVLDYGCGAGRLAKEIRLPVIGVDSSPRMRQYAEAYVGRSDFCACSPQVFRAMVDAGLRFNGGLAVWCLQHVVEVAATIELIAKSMNPGALLFVTDSGRRYIPLIDAGGEMSWASDGIDIYGFLDRWFEQDLRQDMPLSLCAPGSMLSTWTRRS